MKERQLDLKLPAPLVAPLLDLLLPLAAEEGDAALAIAPDLGAIEEDFREQWRSDLAAMLSDDMAKFAAALLREEFRKEGVLRFVEADWEPLLRVCSALRLKLRTRHLTAIADTPLETGEIDPARLNRDEQIAMTAYMFLATLQEVIVRQLDPRADAPDDDDGSPDDAEDEETDSPDEDAAEGEGKG